jgi:predicted transcriptional regulator
MIYKLRNEGLYTKDIANIVGVSNDVVKKWLHMSW